MYGLGPADAEEGYGIRRPWPGALDGRCPGGGHPLGDSRRQRRSRGRGECHSPLDVRRGKRTVHGHGGAVTAHAVGDRLSARHLGHRGRVGHLRRRGGGRGGSRWVRARRAGMPRTSHEESARQQQTDHRRGDGRQAPAGGTGRHGAMLPSRRTRPSLAHPAGPCPYPRPRGRRSRLPLKRGRSAYSHCAGGASRFGLGCGGLRDRPSVGWPQARPSLLPSLGTNYCPHHGG